MPEPAALARYQRKVARLQKGLDHLSDRQVRELYQLLSTQRRQVVAELNTIAMAGNAGTFEAYQLGQLRMAIDRQAQALIVDYGRFMGNTLETAWETGAALAPEALKTAGVELMLRDLSRDQLVMAQNVAAELVTKVGQDFRGQARGIITRGLMGQQSPHQIMGEVAELLRTEPRRADPRLGNITYQAERIVRTETLGVANLANQAQDEQIAREMPGMRKYWLASGARNPRPEHVAAGNRYGPGGSTGPIPIDEDYVVGGERASAPHDPRLSAGNRINCGCLSVLYHPDWEGK